MQAERAEEYFRFLAATVASGILTDLEYDMTSGTAISSSGTVAVAEWPETMWAAKDYALQHVDQINEPLGVVTSIAFSYDLGGSTFVESPLSLDFSSYYFGGSGIARPEGAKTVGSDDIFAVADYARKCGLEEIADRLIELGRQPVEYDDDQPIDPASSICFVDYCIARHKKGRPLMTRTPTGELDVTWKSSTGETVIMRFFPNRWVWVALNLLMEKGSFETSVDNLSSGKSQFKIPEWA